MNTESTILIQSKEHLEQFIADNESCILYFSSQDCNVCQVILPKLMERLKSYPIKVAKINTHEQMEIAGQFLVFTVPTVLLLHKSKEILRESRFIDMNRLEKTTLCFLKEE